ncbi:MAG TPA: F0F1 ATP synthase subunit B [Tepidisphaeraceae bacterium]|jgi:F-type H+-transporting ATPase subunit b|nr:F0F1 ATP synthase subunit B [Tepidisphaeraceae bacterium]
MHWVSLLGDNELVSFDMGSALWILGVFVVLCILLYKLAWKHVLTGLNAREARIRKDISDAELAHREAEKKLKEYQAKLAEAADQVQSILAKAATDAGQLAAKIRADAMQQAEEQIERAHHEIEAARNQAVTEIYAEVGKLATSIAEKILRRNLNPDDQRDLVNQSLEQLQKVASN